MKILWGIDYISDVESFLLKNNNNITRGHCTKLYKKRCITTLRQSFFHQRLVNSWNALLPHIVNVTSVDDFKIILINFIWLTVRQGNK